MSTPTHTNHPGNRLIHETSPYLQQHAHNPVDWYPWGAEALERARRENKPILVSIGYSACHWCHVMEHESFEDEEVARVMNELFVCIKVDREERPDLDKIYQTAHQILAQRPGGWPLNMFLTPDDQMPFFGGTYFPKTAKHGLPAFTDLLRHVAEVYAKKPDAIREQNLSLRDIFGRLQPPGPAPGVHLGPEVLDQAHAELQNQFDARYGGFGKAPKFPHPTSLELCLHRWAHSTHNGAEDKDALHMARHTLTAMAHGGLYDQVGGGFCRYSVDERWEIPHFEKMLYDNAQLLMLYVDAWLATGESLFQRIAVETAEWVMREMQSPEGGYYSALDADSEGHEGKFYVWTADEIRKLLTPAEWDVVEQRFGLPDTPNFEGQWHLNVRADHAAIADRFQCPEDEVVARLESAREKLYAAREQRVRPGRDEKILTSWNGLMIQSMAHAGRALERPDFIASAERAMDFIRTQLWRDQRLLATHKDGKSHLNAYLDDHVFLIAAALELLQAGFRRSVLDFSIALADSVLEHFEDEIHGGFYFTGDDHEKLVYRPKPVSDDAIPSGNGVAALVLGRLGHLTGNFNYLHAAERTLEALYSGMLQQPSTHGALLLALEEQLSPPQTVVLRGTAEAMRPWQTIASGHYHPHRVLLAIPANAENLPGILAERTARNVVTAYVCAGHACSAPVSELAEFETALK
ncbi:MAG: thioredoxin domain-containing protein [Sulfuricaulis sp.]|uniref:thioredoxin domain-containing protein n=1 Tax=Sulfuricaulis sp. TaxID=2003553 RepID=UPI0025F626BE|nr:thioredoxin domain-containing protein [Sulfuricaulis sp.]MCR4346368.1 thioredoxin domain-containing protein [Sulfuricaulis sp.]